VRRFARRVASVVALAALVLAGAAGAQAQQPRRYPVTGLVVEVDPSRTSFVVSHESIPDVMPAMTMPFEVRERAALAGVTAGATVRFTLVLGRESAYAEGVQIVRDQSVEQDPSTARRLELFKRITGTPSTAIAVGGPVPDFTLIDQARKTVTLSQLRGKVVVVNFIYTTCVLPQFCYRMANHFSVLQKRFDRRMGTDLILLTVTFDPVRDTPERLAEYASQWKVDPARWHFLTGAVADVRRVCGWFGVAFFPDEGLMNHSVHTAVIDRRGTLRANIEGNRLTAAQLGDFVAAVLER
jgi:protein SCO1/2